MTAPLLVVAGLRASYGEARVLHGVDLKIGAGEVVALLGRNGAGRSTLAKALVGLVDREGSVRFDGEELGALPTFEIARRGIGYVAERRDVFPTLTVDENLRLGLRPGMGVQRRVARAALDESYARFPMLAARRRTPAGRLSGGEQQMLALVRALLGRPRLLVVDEPTEGLAPRAVADVMDCLRAVSAAGGAVLLIEQRFTIAREVAARAAVMGHGRLVFDGAMQALDTGIVDEWITVG
ncbi:ABC transporter ATP-binding protein [Trinickia caryophylli]|uniref:Amino acid/amide ABC transporter ATP-binding protein 2, HAAT family n=1 Tax=Trinickia caryophylli TaxID=28094 RepID=A0A1X7E145_TRICW|nr:ABC transporter ATP-binding protein [Trinickia caryophylli]PMS14085.1 ABC transporter ATP-binding protein [Trinickia caryophylli]TRX17784.1 ABC transporter ATP-binding protein [Trinickia caryophylli]WQE11450.1 ABC transporter ATP-binding protein [Trinickia caryophylli]SMF25069.1 amino acid/amide ABC transporter ATP-binding protein 2, HAAT family [Trinickia caryophylli]GLU32615.1 ABC transporter ATP-binding protein [Trinickia caryophylli]